MLLNLCGIALLFCMCAATTHAANCHKDDPDCIDDCCQKVMMRTMAGEYMKLQNRCFYEQRWCILACYQQCFNCIEDVLCQEGTEYYSACDIKANDPAAVLAPCAQDEYNYHSNSPCTVICLAQGCLHPCFQPGCDSDLVQEECNTLCGGNK